MSRTSPQADDSPLEKATRRKLLLRAVISGATGSGKTCTALRLANALVARYGGKIGIIDTQNKQSLDYAETEFDPHGFYPIHLPTGRPEAYINAISRFQRAGDFSVVIIDSLSDAWQGEGGVLEQAGDDAQFKDWGPAKKGNFKLMTTIQRAPFHIIATVLADTQYLIKTGADGKIQKGDGISVVGTKPIQDKKTMPKFPLQLAMDEYHYMTVVRTSFSPFDRQKVNKPDETFWEPYLEWMDKGKVDKTDFNFAAKVASLEQLSEYYSLQGRRGLNQDNVTMAFFKKYGFKPEDANEDFLEERLEELRGTAGRLPVSSSNPGNGGQQRSPRFNKGEGDEQPGNGTDVGEGTNGDAGRGPDAPQ